MSTLRKRRVWIAGIVATLLGIVGYAGTAYGYIARTDAPSGSAGTYGYNAQGQSEITGGTDFYILSTSGSGNPLATYASQPWDYFEYAPDGITIINGNDTLGGIYHFDLVNASGVVQDSNNGYLEVGKSSVSSWINALKGDPTYVASHEWNTTFVEKYDSSISFPVSGISQIVNMSGACFKPNDPTYNHTVYVTNPPSSVSVDFPSGSTVVQGKSLALNLQEGIEAYHSNYHYENIQIVGADGKDYTSAAGFSYEGAAIGTQTLSTTLTHGSDAGQTVQMTEVKGGGTTSYPPTPVTTINGGGGYNSPEYLNTGSLPAQTYTVYYQVRDYFNRAGTEASASFTVTPAVGPVVSLSASPTLLSPGQSSTLTATASNVPVGDYILIKDLTSASLGGSSTYSDGVLGETSLTTKATYYAAGTNNYEAELVNKSTGAVDATSSQVSVTWQVAPQTETITISANPATVPSGEASTISYTTTGMIPGDYVSVTGTGGQDMWNVSYDMWALDSRIEIEAPYNGATTTVSYVATLYNSSGVVLAHAGTTVTWNSQAPQITLTADHTSLMPDEPAHITYSCTALPSGDTVDVVGTGSGAKNLWNVSNQTSLTESDTEVENPGTGASIPADYVAYIRDAGGNVVSQATLDLTWTNAWSGNIVLSASPTYLQVQNPSSITATLSAPLPSGYVLNIIDQTTGTTIASSVTGSVTDPYVSYYPATNTFVAIISDGYENIGSPSNTATVTWSQITLAASPEALQVGHASTLTVSAQEVPSGDYLVLYNTTKSQVVGYTQSDTYTTTQTESNAESDTYVAYINTSPVPGGYAASDPVTVAWYSVNLTAVPNDLPINNTSTLTATAQNIPSGYVLMIIDRTAGQVIAQGTAGQTTVTTTVSKPVPQTNNYTAAVAVPNVTSQTLSAPKWLTDSSNQSTRPSVALDANGTKHIVFESYLYNASTPNIAYMTISKSGVESPIMWLTSSASAASYAPSISLDSSGNSHIAFGSYLYNGTAENIAYMTVSQSGTASGITWLTQTASGYSGIYPSHGVKSGYDDNDFFSGNKYAYYNTSGPSIVVDASGVSHIVFNSTVHDSNTIYFNAWNIAYMTVSAGGAPSGMTWLTSGTTYSSTAPSLAVDGSEVSHVVFHSVTYNSYTSGVGVYNIAYLTVSSAGSPSGVTWLTQSTTYHENSEFPQIALDSGGTSHVEFVSAIYNFASNIGAFNTAYMTVSPGGTPSGITWVTTFGVGGSLNDFTDSAIQVDSTGTSQIVFGTIDENSYYGTSQLGYVKVSPSGAVSSLTWVTTALIYHSVTPSLVVDGSDVVHLFFASMIEYPNYLNIAYVTITPPSTLPTVIAAETNLVPVTWYQYLVTLAANPTLLSDGQVSVLTANASPMPSDGAITITNEAGQTIYTGPVGVAAITPQVTSLVALTHTYQAHLIDGGSDVADSNTVSVTWVNTQVTLDTPQVSGLLDDPGRPNYMWLPIPESEFANGVGPGKFWWPTFSQHGWNTVEQGGPDATQLVQTVQAHSLSTGQTVNVGIYSAQASGQDPLVWARPASAFALRLMWHGPQGIWPAGGTATWTQTNPDGDYVQWTSPINVYPATQTTGSGEEAEAINTYTGLLPRLVYQGGVESPQYAEPVAWGLGNTNLEASSEGAHISVKISLQDSNGVTINTQLNDVAILYSWPTWYMTWSH